MLFTNPVKGSLSLSTTHTYARTPRSTLPSIHFELLLPTLLADPASAVYYPGVPFSLSTPIWLNSTSSQEHQPRELSAPFLPLLTSTATVALQRLEGGSWRALVLGTLYNLVGGCFLNLLDGAGVAQVGC